MGLRYCSILNNFSALVDGANALPIAATAGPN